MLKHLLLTLTYIACIVTFGYTTEPVILTDNLDELWLGNQYAEFFEDTSTELGIQEIVDLDHAGKFNDCECSDLINQNTNSAYWIKFQIIDNRSKDTPFRIEVFDFDIEEISFFSPIGSGKYIEKKAGFSIPFEKREALHKNVGFKINMAHDDTLTMYMRFFSQKPNILEPTIRSYDRTLNYGLSEYILLGLFYGLLTLVIFTNLVYFIMMRRIYYLFYVMYALCITLYLMDQNGTGFQYLWPNTPSINNFIGVLTLFLGIEALLLFTITFLELKNKSKKLHKIIWYAIYARAGFFLLQILYPKALPWLVVDALFVQFAFFSGWWLYRSGDWSSKWFVIAFSILNASFIITALENAGLIASGAHTVYALNAGIIFQFLVLSIGNAEAVKQTYRDRNATQKKLIQEYQRNETLKEKVNRELEQKVRERTLELRKQKDLVDEKNQHIMASVRYAQTIQNAALPSKENIHNILEDFFVLYLPRDVVSGDFYWTHQISEDEYLIAAVDCTGHGIPGAFMSMIGINLLNRIVSEETYSPAKILSLLHSNIQEVLKQKKTGNRDGMDMALCLVNKKEKTLTYAGAKNPLLFLKDGEITKIRGSRHGIGGAEQDADLHFEEHTISFKDAPVKFYIYSDGFVDQFGGPENKKFLQKRFSTQIENIQHTPMEAQGDQLRNIMLQWMGTTPQVDDILVIGFELK